MIDRDEISHYFKELGHKRWAGVKPADRSAHATMMNRKRWSRLQTTESRRRKPIEELDDVAALARLEAQLKRARKLGAENVPWDAEFLRRRGLKFGRDGRLVDIERARRS